MKHPLLFVWSFLIFPGLIVKAQLSGYNMAEFQYGNLPEEQNLNRSSLYNQLNLNYTHENVTLFTRFEQFHVLDSVDRDYIKPTQVKFRYQNDDFQLQVGNIQETLGKGLLFRTYEIPGSIFESRGWRVRHGFYRDMLGAAAKYTGEHIQVKAIRGKSLNNLLPPTLSEEKRRVDLTEALEVRFSYESQALGFIAMRHLFRDNTNTYGSVFFEGILPLNLLYYIEFAQQMNDQKLFTIKNTNTTGLYTSLSGSAGILGYALEYKNYKNLFLGTGISDPPTLVKEHSYLLLNRKTHVPELDNEQGVQAELFITLPKFAMITLNHSQGAVKIGDTFRFWEYFVEYSGYAGNHEMKVFADLSEDELSLEENRFTTGFDVKWILKNQWNLNTVTEWQRLDRLVLSQKNIQNLRVAATLAKSTRFSVGVQYEFTTDPFETDKTNTRTIEKQRHFSGITTSYRPNAQHLIQLFAGERRGGPACTSGICYEVLDFKGIELRFKSTF